MAANVAAAAADKANKIKHETHDLLMKGVNFASLGLLGYDPRASLTLKVKQEDLSNKTAKSVDLVDRNSYKYQAD